ncbi:hypothetical protein VNO78_12620 [Psophocarpus tetragonolobus]|uniref:Disease resistance RPP13-like protein 1 n=1 Tax=Psophocarpus tetragonolobus TaxID=3891 RepID=A0AAN9SPE9_PSOTE
MAMAFVGEAFLSASVEVLLDSIVSHEFLHFFRSKELDISLLKKLKITLLSLQAVLNDAEEKQITNPAIKEWLDELTHALYDADDLLDEINTEALRCKVEAVSQSQPIGYQVRNFLSYPFKKFYRVINSEMEVVLQRLEQFALQKDILGLTEGISSRVWHGTPTSSVVDESAIYGRDDDKKILKDYLLSEEDNGGGSEIGVITIVGMGGLGKTTLAKLLYNDHDVKEKFDLKAWAYISKDFDVCKLPILKELIFSGLKSVRTVGTEFYGSSSSNSNTLSFQPFPSLEILSFEDMPEWEEWNLTRSTSVEFPILKRLFLCDCPKLKGNLPHNLPSVTELELSKCPLLNSANSNSNPNSQPLPLPLPLMQLSLYSLKELTISSMPSLTWIPENALPTTLHSLTLLSCENLQFPTHDSLPRFTSLEKLQIFNSCDSLTSFPLGGFPVLKSLFILGCKTLKSITVTQHASPHSLSCLQSLSIYACPSLESFPEPEASFTTPNLNHLLVSSCRKLTSLPEPINALSGLYQLSVYGLPRLRAFAEAGLPAHLRILEISVSRGLATSAVTDNWGLQKLTCLAELRVRGDWLLNALMKREAEAPLLPTSLVSVRISHLYYVKCLEGKWLRHLVNLENVEIWDCRRLETLPEEGMASSIAVLTIKRCVLLEAHCQRNGGREWNKIAHIPCVIVNNTVII